MVMKTFFIKAKDSDKVHEMRHMAEKFGFEFTDKNPDFIISLGGDGTFLASEREFPGIPKLLARDSMICFKCHDEPVEEILEKVKDGKFAVIDIMKLEASHNDDKLVATNDIIIRNKEPNKALRFHLTVNDKQVDDLIIGDGIVVASPFGSTGYYHSITRESVESGFGVALNNITKEISPIQVDDSANVTFELIRGEAYLAADDNPNLLVISEGDKVVIKKSDSVGKILTHNG